MHMFFYIHNHIYIYIYIYIYICVYIRRERDIIRHRECERPSEREKGRSRERQSERPGRQYRNVDHSGIPAPNHSCPTLFPLSRRRLTCWLVGALTNLLGAVNKVSVLDVVLDAVKK